MLLLDIKWDGNEFRFIFLETLVAVKWDGISFFQWDGRSIPTLPDSTIFKLVEGSVIAASLESLVWGRFVLGVNFVIENELGEDRRFELLEGKRSEVCFSIFVASEFEFTSSGLYTTVLEEYLGGCVYDLYLI